VDIIILLLVVVCFCLHLRMNNQIKMIKMLHNQMEILAKEIDMKGKPFESDYD